MIDEIYRRLWDTMARRGGRYPDAAIPPVDQKAMKEAVKAAQSS